MTAELSGREQGSDAMTNLVNGALGALLMTSANATTPPSQIGKFDMSYPFPAPDGKALAFQANFDGRWQLYQMNLADGALKRLQTSEKDDTHPAFSPDGKWLAFISNRTGNDEVYLLEVATGAVRNLTPHPGKDGHPKWSRDGAWITFNRTFDPADKSGDGDSAILRVRPDGTGLEVVGSSPRVETFPSFSPDGRSIVFVEWFSNAAGERNRNGELVVVDVATHSRRKITNSDAFDAYPYWGPSGNWIYFSTPVQDGSGRPEFAVHRIRPDGSDLERITEIDGSNRVRAIPTNDEGTLIFNIPANGSTFVHSLPIRGDVR
jgi:Tol biopolymer transport system component